MNGPPTEPAAHPPPPSEDGNTSRNGDAPSARYIALIGDIVASRNLADRAERQRELLDLLPRINEHLGDKLQAPLQLTAGDEVQALLTVGHADGVIDIVTRMADTLHPVRWVWGLGLGGVTTDVGDNVAAMDGPCFHRARRAVEAASTDGHWLRADGLDGDTTMMLEAVLRLIDAVRSRWTATQLRYIRGARQHPQREVATRYDVDESTVSKALTAARFRDVAAGERAARHLLGGLRAKEGTR